MPLIYDRDLLNELLKIAQDPAAGGQPRQPTSTTVFTPEQIKGIATKFLQNLQQLSTETQEEFTAEKGGANLSTPHLKDLPSLLNFLQTSGISTNGLKLVIPHATQAFSSSGQGLDLYKQLKPEQQKLYAKYPNVDGENFQYYVYKDGLVKYVQHLEEKASGNDPGARLMRHYIAPLLQQIQDQLEINVPAAGQAKPLDPRSVLDQLPGVLVFESPYEAGSYQLLPAMLATNGTLFQAISAWGIKLKQGNQIKPVKEAKDLCTVVQILYTRAKNDVGTKGDEVAKGYLQLITTLAGSMNCSLGGNPEQQGQEQGAYQTVGYVTSTGGLSPAGAEALSQIELPLVPDQIVFSRIKTFTDKFRQMFPQSRITEPIYQDLTAVSAITPVDVQALRVSTYTEIANQIAAGGGRPAEYIAKMSSLVTNVVAMLGTIAELCRKAPSMATTQLAQDIQDQIQNTARNNYYGVRNLQSKLEGQMAEVANQVKQQQGRR